MAINLVIAVTDGDWFDMLRQQANLAEVNFWAPSAANFRALQPGEMFPNSGSGLDMTQIRGHKFGVRS